jgi:AbrB family looped-hinge helix DNA binding protein
MKRRLGTKGEVIIPKAIREQLGLTKGSALIVQLSGHVITITPESERATLRPAPEPSRKARRAVDWDGLAAKIPPTR